MEAIVLSERSQTQKDRLQNVNLKALKSVGGFIWEEAGDQ